MKYEISGGALLLIYFVLLAVFPSNQIVSQELNTAQKHAREEQVLRTATWLGAGGALAVSSAMFAHLIWVNESTDALILPDAPTWKGLLVAIPSVAVFTAASGWSMNRFATLYTDREVSKWWSVPVGVLGGAAVGAFIGATGFTTTVGIASPLNVVDTGQMTNYAAVIGMSLLAGAFWGGLTGVVPGAVVGPAISFYVDY